MSNIVVKNCSVGNLDASIRFSDAELPILLCLGGIGCGCWEPLHYIDCKCPEIPVNRCLDREDNRIVRNTSHKFCRA